MINIDEVKAGDWVAVLRNDKHGVVSGIAEKSRLATGLFVYGGDPIATEVRNCGGRTIIAHTPAAEARGSVQSMHEWCEQDKHDEVASTEDRMGALVNEARDRVKELEADNARLVRERETAYRELRNATRHAGDLREQNSLLEAKTKVAEHHLSEAKRERDVARSLASTQTLRADQAWKEVHRLRSEVNRLNGRRLSPHKLIRSWLNGGRP